MRDFSKARRIVIKIGTNTLTLHNALDSDYIQTIAVQVKTILDAGKQVVLVSSGAIVLGMGEVKTHSRPGDVASLQALAAIGSRLLQGRLVSGRQLRTRLRECQRNIALCEISGSFLIGLRLLEIVACSGRGLGGCVLETLLQGGLHGCVIVTFQCFLHTFLSAEIELIKVLRQR